MSPLRTWRSSWLATATLALFAVLVPLTHADVIQSTPSLPPQGAYTTGTVCFPNLGPGVCIVGTSLYGFTGTTSVIGGGGQSIDSSISLAADVYTDNNGMPGTLIGPVSLGGPIGIFYSGRGSDTELGTFISSLTELDLTGAFNGHSIELILNPNTTSSGPTTVAPSGGNFQISSFFDVFTELSLDSGPFIPGPMRTFVLTPEPGSITLLALGMVGVLRKLRGVARPGD